MPSNSDFYETIRFQTSGELRPKFFMAPTDKTTMMTTSSLAKNARLVLEFLVHCSATLMCTYGLTRFCHMFLLQ